eukprot:scaffold4971_cov254-Pinguiococcus_pyrenoidosus.AAC.15
MCAICLTVGVEELPQEVASCREAHPLLLAWAAKEKADRGAPEGKRHQAVWQCVHRGLGVLPQTRSSRVCHGHGEGLLPDGGEDPRTALRALPIAPEIVQHAVERENAREAQDDTKAKPRGRPQANQCVHKASIAPCKQASGPAPFEEPPERRAPRAICPAETQPWGQL